MPAKGHRSFTHGIRATYASGRCHLSLEEGCPGHPETGISCREAWRIARVPKVREYRQRPGMREREAELARARRDRKIAEDPVGYRAKQAARMREYYWRKRAEARDGG